MALSLEPGFLDFDNLPETNFSCVGKVIGGYYADLETNCQMFHVCTIGQADEPMDIRFLCLNGTVFDQETRVCERIDEVDCSKSEQFYSLNLELYGNSGPLVEENLDAPQETEPSIIIKATTSTTTTTTTTTTKRPTTNPSQYYTTIRTSTATTSSDKQQSVSGHQFSVNSPDIRFNPEEINISLNAGAPPDIRTKHFQPHHSFSDDSKLEVNNNPDNDEEQSVRVQKPEKVRVTASTSPKPSYAIDNSDSDKLTQNIESFDFSEEEFHGTEVPRQQQFLIQTNSFRHSQSFPHNNNHNNNQYHRPQFHSTTVKQPTNNFHQDRSHTTIRTLYLHSLKPPAVHQHHHYTHHSITEKTPQRVQIPIPLLPTLPPLTFSSPAPFTLQRHLETKRYTKDHPKIIISASATISDASGRRLNIGPINPADILQTPPSSYDEYKESDVGLDPFYHNVPKLRNQNRKKRSLKEEKLNPFDVIKNENEAVAVLKFLFKWYESHQATATVPPVTSPISPDLIRKINDEFAPTVDSHNEEYSSTEASKLGYASSKLFEKNSKFSIIGGFRNENSQIESSEDQIRKDVGQNAFLDSKALDQQETELIEHDSSEMQTHNSETENNPGNFKEKIDDGDSIFLDKEHIFNPNDYVDDNYEGISYKKNVSTKTKEPEYHEENTKNESATKHYDMTDNFEYLVNNSSKHFGDSSGQLTNGNSNFTEDSEKPKTHIDPLIVAELLKYFNVSRLLTFNSLNTTATDNQSGKEYIGEKASSDFKGVVKDTPSKYSEVNVLSEVNKKIDLPHSSSPSPIIETITSTSTITTEFPKHTARRRGRGRQRALDSQHEASYSSNVSKLQTEENLESRNQISNGKRGRNRGRSRYSFSRNPSTTTTTTTTSTTTKSIFNEDYEPVTLSSVREPNLDELVDERAKSTETYNLFSEIYNSEIRETDRNSKDIEVNVTKKTPTVDIAEEIRVNDTILNTISERGVNNTLLSAENEAIKSSKDDSTYLIKLLKYYAESAMTEINKVSTTELPGTSYEPLTKNEPTSTTSLDISDYLTTRNEEHNYYKTSSTLPTLKDIYQKTNVHSDYISSYEELEENEHIKSKTNLLHKLIQIQHNLADILNDTTIINVPIADTTATTPLISFEEKESFGTTFSTVTESTKFSELNKELGEPTKMLESNTEPFATDLLKVEKNYDSTYDDLFTVPELTERSTEYINSNNNNIKVILDDKTNDNVETTISSYVALKANKTDNKIDPDVVPNYHSTAPTIMEKNVTEPERTTSLPEVEIQKSISLPIAVLENSFDNDAFDAGNAYDINGLLSTTRDDDELKTTSILDIPNTIPTTSLTDQSTEITELKSFSTERTPSTAVTIETTQYNHDEVSTKYVDEHLKNIRQYSMPEVQQNATEIIFIQPNLRDEESPGITQQMGDIGKVNSSHLFQVVIETSTESIIPTTTRIPHHTRRTRPPRRPYNNQRNAGRHRFSTELSTTHPIKTEKQNLLTSQILQENITDAPLYRSATPTRSELKKVSLHTTPLSHRSPVKVSKYYVFNCFGKDINRFYADPRDCRLFHYCTQGYSKNQLLDLKYVCDQKTFFDEDKLICTKVKPDRCL